jgi:hypothetical protein
MVFDVALPFLGITVTVTLQEPAFNPLRVVPETLQNFAELATTFNLTFEVESTLSLANVAIDFAETGLDIVTLGITVTALLDPTNVRGVVVEEPELLAAGDVVVEEPELLAAGDVVVEEPELLAAGVVVVEEPELLAILVK